MPHLGEEGLARRWREVREVLLGVETHGFEQTGPTLVLEAAVLVVEARERGSDQREGELGVSHLWDVRLHPIHVAEALGLKGGRVRVRVRVRVRLGLGLGFGFGFGFD